MREILSGASGRSATVVRVSFCFWPLLAPVFLAGCVSGADSLRTSTRPGALADDMTNPVPTVIARLQQPDGDGKNKPFTPPQVPPSPPSFPGLAPPPASALQIPAAPSQADMIVVRAWVNGRPIFDDEFGMNYPPDLKQAFAGLAPNDPKVKEIIQGFRDKLIDQELMYQDAVNKLDRAKTNILDKLKKEAHKKYEEQIQAIRDNFKKRSASLSEAEYRKEETKFLEQLRHLGCLLKRKAEREFIATEYMRSRVVPKLLHVITPKEIKEEYETHTNMYVFPGKLKWQDVFIPLDKDHPTAAETRRYAEGLLAANRNDFQKLIDYDKGDSKHRGGEGSGSHPTYKLGDKTVPTDIRPIEMEPHLLRLKEGQTEIVDIPTGVHIIRLVKFEPSYQRPFNQEVQLEIRNRLRGEVFEREVKYLVRDLRTRADIVMVPD